jgi:hypothetical protein
VDMPFMEGCEGGEWEGAGAAAEGGVAH